MRVVSGESSRFLKIGKSTYYSTLFFNKCAAAHHEIMSGVPWKIVDFDFSGLNKIIWVTVLYPQFLPAYQLCVCLDWGRFHTKWVQINEDIMLSLLSKNDRIFLVGGVPWEFLNVKDVQWLTKGFKYVFTSCFSQT